MNVTKFVKKMWWLIYILSKTQEKVQVINHMKIKLYQYNYLYKKFIIQLNVFNNFL